MLNLADLAKFSMFFARLQKLKPDRPKKRCFPLTTQSFGGWVGGFFLNTAWCALCCTQAQRHKNAMALP